MSKNLYETIEKGISEKNLSHAFLVETNSPEQTLEEIYKKFVENKVFINNNIENNLSVLVVRPENNNVDKNKILDIQKFLLTKNSLDEYKVYFILEAEKMNTSSTNKLLKVLEEPGENTVGFLITENANMMLETIISRCERFKASFELSTSEEVDLNIFSNIELDKYFDIIEKKKKLLSLEKQELLNLLGKYRDNLVNNAKSVKEINKAKLVTEIIEKIEFNTNTELCLDKLFIEMRK